MKRFKQTLIEDFSDVSIKESLVGKAFAVSQNRQHHAIKSQLITKLSAIQNDCRRAAGEDDEKQQAALAFKIVFDLATAMKMFAEMSVKTNNIATSAVLDADNIKALISKAFKNYIK